jgi:hypothetical protein
LTNLFWNSPTYKIIKAMKATGNQPGVIAQWKDMVEAWAVKNKGPDAEAVKAWLPMWQVRPMYTAAELAPIFPMLAVALRFADRPTPQMSPKRLENELIYGALPRVRLVGDDYSPYFIVERIHHWRDRVLTQEDFQEILK